jgi:hypothetical protein
MAIANDYLAFFVEPDPGVDSRDFVIGHYHLATGRIPANEQTLGTDREGATSQEPASGFQLIGWRRYGRGCD